MKINKTRMICEAAIFIAMAEILSLIKLYEFPNGGSITLEMLPIILLSGMMFPVENMPWPLRWLSNIVPAKWYIMAVKDVMIKGLPWTALLDKIGILSLMIVVLVGISVRRFKVRLS